MPVVTTAWLVRGLLVEQARLREGEGLILDPETPGERLDLDALAASVGISKPTLSRVLTGECDRRSEGPWEPSARFRDAIKTWLGLNHRSDADRKIEKSPPAAEIRNGRTAHIPYPKPGR